MYLVIAAVLVVCWIAGFTLFHVASFGIHILLILAVLSLVGHFVSRSRA